MFGNWIVDTVAAPSFLYLMIAEAYFRQVSCAPYRHLRHALCDSGGGYLTSADRAVPAYGSSGGRTQSSHI
jgi:hypothetical protein